MDDKMIVPGFLFNGIHAGIKDSGRKDLALIFSQSPAAAAGVFTTNRFAAPPVLVSRERLAGGSAQAVLINSGNANAATGEDGLKDVRLITADISRRLRIDERLVLAASTGKIGERLPTAAVLDSLDPLIEGLAEDRIGIAEEAIMTTDRFPKIEYRKGSAGGADIAVCGIAKGAGMIEPGMATMLAFFMTDAVIEAASLDFLLREAAGRSFNAISVDGCMSTNDTAIVLANGRAGNKPLARRSAGWMSFREMLFSVAEDLARAMVRDGEGATKLIEISVEGARTLDHARKAAYAVARSNLVKAAFFGRDPNWGRIISALGASGVPVDPEAAELYFEEEPVFLRGTGAGFDPERIRQIMAQPEIRLRIRLGAGRSSFRMFASDLTYDYVRINAEYHT
ncbi:MAG: bifunctional glutamate N-acetyltransferase/amino-acid acetyltransferase ArgJ [Syntrophales bacterium]|nr:bifunctional glutamate N-acetyltransferase/amino-acid acetyltransferase ArgJ [Syntrophales bacterium]MDD5233607.1 bifunctional glutamate N-acetyltransferase/amino-acid acetyltransferase ArgJ [Syntrophales bacterium]MDD5531684.1 bifunctional glutamate N-acetyltransferase/amino-acid acetyltransferase ArgJ [Syntrophales bacterium]